jgi:hypothetical protein
MWPWVPDPAEPTLCTALEEDDQPCQAQAVPGTDPPTCSTHLHPTDDRRLGPTGISIDPDQVITSIDDAIEKLGRELGRIGTILDQLTDYDLVGNFSHLYAQHMSRYGDLLLKQQTLQGRSEDPLLDLLEEALDRLNEKTELDL